VSGSFAADGLLARIDLERAATPELADAFSALDAGATERGLDLLLDAIPSADGDRDEIRKVIVGVLDELGPENELARASRRRLAAALY
jgi:putative thioredoxin